MSISKRSDTRRSGMRVGFLYNHDDVHQVAHTAPLISAIQRRSPDIEIEVLVSSEAQAQAVTAFLDPGLPRPRVRDLRPGRGSEVLERLVGGVAPIRRVATLRNNLPLLRTFDALVVPETTSTLLKTRFGLDELALIYLPHGAGDRAVGFGPEVRHFDFVLLSGDKVRDRMLRQGIVRPGAHAVVGYPKLDALASGLGPTLFSDDRPVVLYNPHCDPALSSWYDFGPEVLEFFARQDHYNLIFAPHVMLFRRKLHASVAHRRVRLRRSFPDGYRDSPRILVDLGSSRSVDMTYVRAADMYLGDVSSQIYEFIARPRPAVFLNAHGAEWRKDPNYAHWHLGPVLDDPSGLEDALRRAEDEQDGFGGTQREAFQRTFSVDPQRGAADRAAQAVVDFLGRLPSHREMG